MESDFNNLKSYQRCQSSKRTPVAVSDRRTRRKNWISSCSSTIDTCDEAQAAPTSRGVLSSQRGCGAKMIVRWFLE